MIALVLCFTTCNDSEECYVANNVNKDFPDLGLLHNEALDYALQKLSQWSESTFDATKSQVPSVENLEGMISWLMDYIDGMADTPYSYNIIDFIMDSSAEYITSLDKYRDVVFDSEYTNGESELVKGLIDIGKASNDYWYREAAWQTPIQNHIIVQADCLGYMWGWGWALYTDCVSPGGVTPEGGNKRIAEGVRSAIDWSAGTMLGKTWKCKFPVVIPKKSSNYVCDFTFSFYLPGYDSHVAITAPLFLVVAGQEHDGLLITHPLGSLSEIILFYDDNIDNFISLGEDELLWNSDSIFLISTAAVYDREFYCVLLPDANGQLDFICVLDEIAT